jgi:regulator of sirC expression with transglutaminase-like and TPR domain
VYSCPKCGTPDVADQSTCACGADLTLLRRLDSIADVWFNRALECLDERKPGRALEWLAAYCVARPSDASARRALAKVWAQLGCIKEAGDALQRAVTLDPGAPEIEAIRRALRDARRRDYYVRSGHMRPKRARPRRT